MSMHGDLLAQAHYEKPLRRVDCNTCGNCQMRARFNAMYSKYLKDNGEKADKPWIARQKKLDRNVLICVGGLI